MQTIANKESITLPLLQWYYIQSKPYPWRASTDPYKIWLSEVMLQQTRVQTIPTYYEKWILSLPSIASVASASLNDVLKLWEGLGYYNRAKNFYKSCQIIINQYNGIIPINSKEFQKLPGVGPYIAAAVMSIAFKINIPAIDVNAIRVVSRLFMIKTKQNVSSSKIKEILYNLIDKNNPGDFNQAIMDLGREVCTALAPKCPACPISRACLSHVNSCVDKYPIKVKKSIQPKYRVAVGLIWKDKKLLIAKRPSYKLLGDLWEFPGGKIKEKESPEECLVREANEELDIIIKIDSFIKTISHSYSHFSIIMDAFHCTFVSGVSKNIQCKDHKWILPSEIKNFPFPSASHKLFDATNRYPKA